MNTNGHAIFRALSIIAFASTYVTIILGGNVMASNNGLACPNWPNCDGAILPPLSGPMGIEWSHRLAAGFLGLTIVFLVLAAVRYERGRPTLQRMAYAAGALTLGQALLGGLVVESNLVVGIVLLHLFLATVLFGLLLLLTALANLRDVPRRWLDWAWRASDGETAPADDFARAPSAPGAPASPEPAGAPAGSPGS